MLRQIRDYLFKGKTIGEVLNRLFLLLLIAFFPTCLILSFIAYQTFNDTRLALFERGVTTTGTISRLWTESFNTTRANSPATYFYVAYNFDSHLGDAVEMQASESQVSHDFYESLSEGDTIPVTFLPDDPSTSRINAYSYETHYLVGIICSFLGTLLVIFLLFINIQINRYNRKVKGKLKRDGKIKTT